MKKSDFFQLTVFAQLRMKILLKREAKLGFLNFTKYFQDPSMSTEYEPEILCTSSSFTTLQAVLLELAEKQCTKVTI